MKTITDPGQFRQKIEIESPTETQGDFQETQSEWETFVEARAKIEPINGREGWRYAQVDSIVTHEITMRFRRGITTKMRVKFLDPAGTRYFGIRSVLNTEELNVEHKLICEESVL